MRIKGTLLCLFVLVSAGLLFGQAGATGTILGTVTDSSGAVVANAGVDVTNTATGVVTHVQTGSSGDFTAPFLIVGTYRVTVEAPGFNKGVVDNITLNVAEQARANVTLKTGAVTESVEVQASAVALDTDTSAVSQTVTQRQVNELPLNGRNFLSLLFISAGAVQTNGEMGQQRQGVGNAISLNGSRPESTNYTLDGMANTDTALNTPAVILSQDAIQEFKIQSETYSAEYGFSANQVNIVSKSGTNSLHGSVFEFNRNDAYDAKGPFQTKIPPLRQNQYGFVAGGPVYIPKVYDGRNKTFWLVNYEGWRIKNGADLFYNVPTLAELHGDFNGIGLPDLASPACTAPITGNLARGHDCMPIDPTTDAPFPGNVIPSTSFSRLATVMLPVTGMFPAPNCIGCALGNLEIKTGVPNKVDQETYKLDQSLGHLGTVFFRFTDAKYTLSAIGSGTGTVSIPQGIALFVEKGQSWQISHTVSLGHNMVNNFRFGRLESTEVQGGNPAPTSAVAALGITGTYQNIADPFRLWPTITLNSFTGTSGTAAYGSQGNDATTSDIPMWEFADSLAMTHGKHTVTVGFDYRKWVQKRNLSDDFLGNFGYASNNIRQNSAGCTNPVNPITGTRSCGTGNAVADFLLGYTTGASSFQPGPFVTPGIAGNLDQYNFNYIAPFVQDDWKVTNRLTVNLGLRWDYRGEPYETDNKLFWFDAANPGGGLCYAKQSLGTESVTGLGGSIAPPNNGFYRYCGRKNPADTTLKPFAPRIGVAYRLGDKTVIRGGYGIFNDSFETREMDNSGDQYPFVVRANFNPNANAALPKLTDNYLPPVTLHQVVPNPVTGAYVDGGNFFAVMISEFPKNPYVQQWSFSVQRELARNTTLEANYVGNKGTHLLNRVNIGQPHVLPVDPAVCAADTTAADCPVNARRPYANITSGNGFLDSRWNGYSDYNGLNVKFQRRTDSMAFLASYTWSKSLDDKSATAGLGATNSFFGHMNDSNPRLDYGPSDFNVPHRFVASYVYQLPFGRGKHFGANMNKAADLAVGGWELTGITTFQKGFPFSVQCGDVGNLLLTFGTNRCNLTGNPKGSKSLNQWFNTAAFSLPPVARFGNSGRNILVGPGINNWDVGLDKTFAFTERIHFQLRVETFNTFNHADYGLDPTQPGVGPGDGSVGYSFNNPTFGKVTHAHPGRIMQLGGKVTF